MVVKKVVARVIPKLIAENYVWFYYWSPGYYIKEHGVKKFIPTTTFKAAMLHLKDIHGPKNYLAFKENAHPGHCAVEARNAYLSVGSIDNIESLVEQ